MLNRVFKVSTAAYKNKGSFRNTRIAAVPDRGGRVTDDTVSVEPVPKSTVELSGGVEPRTNVFMIQNNMRLQ